MFTLFSENNQVIVSLDSDRYLNERLTELEKANLRFVEINNLDPAQLGELKAHFPKLKLGIGNIKTLQTLEDAYQAGAAFASSPGFHATLAQTALVYSFPYLPSVATLSEALAAFNLGYQLVRAFPATLSFCTLLNRCIPELQQIPAEIEGDELDAYLTIPSVKMVSLLNPDKHQLSQLAVGIPA